MSLPPAYGDVTSSISNLAAMGFYNYDDASTGTTPFSYTSASGFVELPNDAQGALTQKLEIPGISEVWNPTTNRFDFSGLKDKDLIDIRIDLVITTSSPNQSVESGLRLGIGGSQFDQITISTQLKSAGSFPEASYIGLFAGGSNFLDNPGAVIFKSDGNCSIRINGWYVKIQQIN